MDHYKVLRLEKTATKEEIKAAFKKLALQCHPDKHSQSPKYVQHNAKLRFKQVSEAYEVLMDDRKRAKYNYQSHAGGGGLCRYECTKYYSKYGYGKSGSGYGDKTRSSGLNGGGGGGGGGFGDKFGTAIRNLKTRSSLLNLGYAAAILGGVAVIYSSRESWKMPDPESLLFHRYIRRVLSSLEVDRESTKSPTLQRNQKGEADRESTTSSTSQRNHEAGRESTKSPTLRRNHKIVAEKESRESPTFRINYRRNQRRFGYRRRR